MENTFMGFIKSIETVLARYLSLFKYWTFLITKKHNFFTYFKLFKLIILCLLWVSFGLMARPY